MSDYRVIADGIAADIGAGRLPPGTRLPPQRRFARRHGIAGSTAARVYGELARRGLVVGEVGRGTFVRAAEPGMDPALAEPREARVDLELNFPVLPEQAATLSASLSGLLRPDALGAALPAIGAAGTAGAREAAVSLLGRGGWAPRPECVLFAGNGRQAIAAGVATLVRPGGRLGVETLTYPVVKGIAARLGVTLVPLEMDEHGLLPDTLETTVDAVYLQPVLHNPLGVTMAFERRIEIAESLRRRNLPAIEDAIYGFLRDDLPPLASLAPERVIVVDSLSKRLAPGLTVGFAVTPPELTERVAAAVRTGAWGAQHFAMTAASHWANDGTATAIEQGKRADAKARQRIVAQRLAGFSLRADPHAYHCWWRLPEQWRAETFVAAAARHGIAITPAAAFTVGRGQAPNAVRLALASPKPDTLAGALDVLAALASGTPEDTGPE